MLWIFVFLLPVTLVCAQGHPRVIGDYAVNKTLGSGATSVVYEVVKGGKHYALKMGRRSTTHLTEEYKAMKSVSGKPGFLTVYDQPKCGTDCYVMDLIGPSVSQIMREYYSSNSSLSVECVGAIGVQLIERMEAMHAKGYTHGDLFRNNVATGRGSSNRKLLYVFDFGQAVKKREKRFDVRSVAFTVATLMRSHTLLGGGENFHHFNAMKPGSIKPSLLAWGMNPDVFSLLAYANMMNPTETPDYEKMKEWMIHLAESNGVKYSGEIPWPKTILEKLP